MFGEFSRRPARGVLLATLVVIGLGWQQPARADEAPAAVEPKTLHDAIAGMADLYGISVVGLDRLGTEAPDWPPTDQPPAAILQRLLRDYGYIAELKPGAPDGTPPMRLTIVGLGIDRNGEKSGSNAAMPASLRQADAPRAAAPSTLTRALGQLALSGQGNQAPAPASARATGGTTIGGLSGAAAPAASTAATGGDMAALTRAARANVIGLVTSLRNACTQGARC